MSGLYGCMYHVLNNYFPGSVSWSDFEANWNSPNPWSTFLSHSELLDGFEQYSQRTGRLRDKVNKLLLVTRQGELPRYLVSISSCNKILDEIPHC